MLSAASIYEVPPVLYHDSLRGSEIVLLQDRYALLEENQEDSREKSFRI